MQRDIFGVYSMKAIAHCSRKQLPEISGPLFNTWTFTPPVSEDNGIRDFQQGGKWPCVKDSRGTTVSTEQDMSHTRKEICDTSWASGQVRVLQSNRKWGVCGKRTQVQCPLCTVCCGIMLLHTVKICH